MKLPGKVTVTHIGLVAIIVLALWLIYRMLSGNKKEGFEGVYTGSRAAGAPYADAESYAELDQDETYEEEQEEPYAELSELENFSQWGDGSPVNEGSQPTESFTTLLAEPAYGSDAANALFSPTL